MAEGSNVGWSWDDFFPLCMRSECREDGAAMLRGGSGPLAVSSLSFKHGICDAWDKAPTRRAPAASRKRREEEFATASYLKPARRRRNLRIVPRARAPRILFEGKRAVGVECLSGLANKTEFRARKEVLAACGAIGTPHVLMLSGVGNAGMLQGFDLNPVADLRGVGENPQGRLQIRPVFKCRVLTLSSHMPKIWKRVEFALEYLLIRTDPLTLAASSATGFLRTGEDAATPAIGFHVQPWSADKFGESLNTFPGFTTSVCSCVPKAEAGSA